MLVIVSMLVLVAMVMVETSWVGCRRSRSGRLRRSVRSARDGEVLADDVGDGLLVAADDGGRLPVDRVDGQRCLDALAEEAGDGDDPAVERPHQASDPGDVV